MADSTKKNILTYAGLQELEAELEDLKLKKPENRVIYQKMLSMMPQKMSREILRLVLKKSKRSLRM